MVLRLIDKRANLLPADKVIEEAALDKYSYMRDAYLQNRRSLIHDGNAPRDVEADAEQVERPSTAEAVVPAPSAAVDASAAADGVLLAHADVSDAK